MKVNSMGVRSVRELEVYQASYALAMEIFQLSRRFPTEERYGLTSQIRRASRSVCLNLNEAWAKRRYEAHFISKLTDCDGENNETITCIDFAWDCGYPTQQQHDDLIARLEQIGRMLGAMMRHPERFAPKK